MSSPGVVGFALPRIIKSDEKKLLKSPDNEALRLETGSYYIMYANAFIEGPAKMLPPDQYDKRDKKLVKAKNLYLQGVAVLRNGLEKKYPNIGTAYPAGKFDSFLKQFTKDDVPFLYWIVAGSMAAYSLDVMNMELGLKLPELTAMIKQAYILDPNFNNGAIDDFFISFYGALPAALGGNRDLAKKEFNIAVKKTNGNSASPYISYIEAIAIPEQDYTAFKDCLNKALSVNFSKMKTPEEKLANKIAQKKARFYLKNADRFILIDDQSSNTG
ncbi:MAG: TRAP transporter TatT component family protein [Spirochaetaceae bacterium]|jgi:hypothetical protein|nr:TRAP transporter TatT component family protein [Spirochaetaceae bacterium]